MTQLLGLPALALLAHPSGSLDFDVLGVVVTPHTRAASMRFRRDPGPADGALVRVIVSPTQGATPWSRRDLRANGRTGAEMVGSGAWAWCDFPGDETGAGDPIQPGEATVLTLNTRSPGLGIGSAFSLSLRGRPGSCEIALTPTSAHLASVTFLGGSRAGSIGRMLVHVAQHGTEPLRIASMRVWQPERYDRFWALRPTGSALRLRTYPADGWIAPGDTAIAEASVDMKPTYALVALDLRHRNGRTETLWAHLRARAERFDISGGWVDAGPTVDGRTPLAHPVFVKTLALLHVNTAHYTEVAGYSDQSDPGSLDNLYPLKRFHALEPIERYDRDDMLDRIHAVEFLGEPQYGGGRPVAPQEVWRQLRPYAGTRLPTTVTLSEEAQWRFYAGTSDYPHFDAYRVNAPAADIWRLYDRWEGVRIAWGAPLETIGDMCRSLRELSRPTPIAIWSQGPGNWSSYGGRTRRAPTCDEIRMQAYHALASRITSLYWFNLSLESILKFPDTLAELRRVGREIRMLDDLYLRGSAYGYRRVAENGRPTWDLSSIVAPEAAVLFALDLAYRPDPEAKVFVFGPPRAATFEYELPAYLRGASDVFRVDADGVHEVQYTVTPSGVRIFDRISKVGVYVAARTRGTRAQVIQRRASALARERAIGFDPIDNATHLEALQRIRRLP